MAPARLRTIEAGPPDGPLVILLHGFPEFSYGWRHQVGPLPAAGFRVLAPDQRGYGLSDKPPGIADYRIDRLTDDVFRLAEAAGHWRFSVVGHDWGGIVAWWLALTQPGRIQHLAILNAPHPATLPRHMAAHPRQLLKSWYVAFFQLPGLPERLMRARRYRMAERAYPHQPPRHLQPRGSGPLPGSMGTARALTGKLNWYRALSLHPEPAETPIQIPILIIWGDRDAFLDRCLADEAAALCDDAGVVHLEQASHWVQHEEAEKVNGLLIEFLLEKAA